MLVENLKKHFSNKTKVVQCVDCGEWFEVDVKDNETCRCGGDDECGCRKQYLKILRKEQNKRAYEKRKNQQCAKS